MSFESKEKFRLLFKAKVEKNIAAKKLEELSPVSNYTFSSPSSSINVFFFLNK